MTPVIFIICIIGSWYSYQKTQQEDSSDVWNYICVFFFLGFFATVPDIFRQIKVLINL